ncbi:MAG: LysM peptidoglycan-binding domain-containing protein [Saprospirales bacterium]|nr:MAG: LysM peptidoglycan-binding domain-containing protein [Saprospirales bacterium]
MAKVKRFLNIILLVLPLSLIGQEVQEVMPHGSDGWVVIHEIRAGQTLYAIARLHNAKVSDIRSANTADELHTLSLGQEIKVPLSQNHISAEKPAGKYRVLSTKIRSGDTFYSIARRSGLSVGQLQSLNGIGPGDLKPGIDLKLGYYRLSGTTEVIGRATNISEQHATRGPAIEEDLIPDIGTTEERREESWSGNDNTSLNSRENRGVAVWNQEWKSTAGFYVLHRTAPINSIIEIENPMFGRRAFGKVSGRIPASLYTDDVILIVSDGLANHLGVIDPRFFVKVRYLQPEEEE